MLGFGGQWKAPARTVTRQVLVHFSIQVSRISPQHRVGEHDIKACSYPSYPSTSHLKENCCWLRAMTAHLPLAMEAEGPSVPTRSMLAEGSHFLPHSM